MKVKNLFKLKLHIFFIGFFFGFIFDFINEKLKQDTSFNDKTHLFQIILSNDENLTNSAIQLSSFYKIQVCSETNLSILKTSVYFLSEWYFFTTKKVYINQKKVI